MTVEITFRNALFKKICNVRKVVNASAVLEEDWIYIYLYVDREGYPTYRIPIKDLICVEVKEML